MSGIAWTTVRHAIHTWIRVASGLSADNVSWAAQNRETPELAPTAPWISLDLPALSRVGQDWTDIEASPAPVTPGAEITYKARGNRVQMLTITCFGGPAIDAGRPQAIVAACIDALELPSRRRALVAAGIGVGEVGTIQTLGAVRGYAAWEPRATVQVPLYLASEISETGTDVRSVELTGGLPSVASPAVTITATVTAD